MGEPQFVLDLAGYRLDALDVAREILDLACFGYMQITMRYVSNMGSAAGYGMLPDVIEFYEADRPEVVIGLVKNFAP